MHRAIATVSLSGTLRQKLEAIAAAGFELLAEGAAERDGGYGAVHGDGL